MEIQIQELIDKIKTDGVEKAEQAAEEILAAARSKAAQITEAAQKEAEKIRSEAGMEANKFQATGKQAVIQAGRDMLLNIRAQLTKLFGALIEKEVAQALNTNFLESTLETVVNKWIETGSQEWEIIVPEDKLKQLENFFKAKFKDKLKNGIELRPIPGIQHGFRIGEKDGSAYYDLTDQGIAESLKPYLNVKLAECIDEALK